CPVQHHRPALAAKLWQQVIDAVAGRDIAGGTPRGVGVQLTQAKISFLAAVETPQEDAIGEAAPRKERLQPVLHNGGFALPTLIDGTGREPLTGGLLVQGDRIKDVGRIDPDPDTPGIEVIDLTGRTLMPGMVLGHVHLGYHDVCDFPDLDLRQPPEVATITAV